MWIRLADFILRYRLWLIAVLLLITAFMGFQGRKIEWSYEFMRIVPSDDPSMIYFDKFQKTFGEDANMLAIGMQDSTVYQLENFLNLARLGADVKALEGITGVVSLPQMLHLTRNTEEKRFDPTPIFDPLPRTQQELDSLLLFARELKFYEGKLINPENGATVLLVSFDPVYLNSENRTGITERIVYLGDLFSKKTGIELHYAGLPYVRSIMVSKVRKEMNFFLLCSLGITAVILFLFFRSFSPVIYPLIMIGMVVVWTVGTLAILGYKITMLTGLLPPVLVVIGIPNSIYLLNKYHQEFASHGNQRKALLRVIQKIGVVTLITNTTTAIGFLVLTFTKISALQEFGITAALNIFATFVISIIFIPAVFSFLPPPKTRHIRHLEFTPIRFLLNLFDNLISRYRVAVYVSSFVLVILATWGALQLKAVTYMVDDLPDNSPIRKDLAFFEENFRGVMPLEVVVDTGKEKGIRKRSNIQKVEQLEQYFATIPELTTPVSMVALYKAANQAYFGTPADYRLPSRREEPYVQRYLKNQQESELTLTNSFVDSTGQLLRVSMKVADLGSEKLDSLINQELRPAIDSILADTEMKADVTGTTWIFVQGNDYLIRNLRNSMFIAFFLIAVIMGTLFGNLRIIIISLIPNVIPLILTAGLMGFLNIPLKPSTALVFSIAFGISVDDSIHFLAKYRQELLMHRYDIIKAVTVSLRETGMSMIYTSIVLFCGFVIFAASDFGGTVALGALTSTTLLVAMVTNLILLPSLLRSFDVGTQQVRLNPLIDRHNTFYLEDEDEEIDLERIEVKNPDS